MKAIQTGGESGPVIAPDLLDTPMDIESCAAAGASLGTGDLFFLDEDVSMAELGQDLCSFFAGESCGKCVPCRLGTRKLEALFARLCDGTADGDTLTELEETAEYVRQSAFCALGQAAPVPALSLLRNFRGELERCVRTQGSPLWERGA